MAATQRLAVDCDDLAADGGAHTLCPVAKAFAKLPRIKQRKDAPKGVVGRDAIGKSEECFQPISLGFAKVLEVHERLRAAKHGAEGDQDDVDKPVFLASLDAWINDY